MPSERFDVVVLGAGLAGLTFARHLRQETNKSVLLLERRARLPRARQKVGEATVQVSGYYFGRVLDLEEHLLKQHLMKYNLRFYHHSAGAEHHGWEDFSQSYIAPFSNIPSYQIDRNLFEKELLRGLEQDPGVALHHPIEGLEVELGAAGVRHQVRYRQGDESHAVSCDWVVDASGRGRFLARQLGLERPSPIRHGAAFCWVEGLLDVERMTKLSRAEVRRAPERRFLGHTPFFLATNHFCFEGGWLWLIPLPERTSIGLVFDQRVLDFAEVADPEKLRSWIGRELPLLGSALEGRELSDFSGYRDFAYDCSQTLSHDGWAMTGEAGRFSDPLYSPGSDLIALHNTLIVDAIRAPGDRRAEVCQRHERMLQALYRAYLPAYSVSYDALGDAESMVLKYGWELAIYFAFYVFPFVNDLFADHRFSILFLRRFGRLGALNDAVQGAVSALFQGKKSAGRIPGPRVYFDFRQFPALAFAESAFYEVGLDAVEAGKVLDRQLASLSRFARFILAWQAASVSGEPSRVLDARWVERLELPPAVEAGVLDDSAPERSLEELEMAEWRTMAEALAPFHRSVEVPA